ncbi:hypothetical protein GCQ56_12005 [Marinifilum sp. N1E240]|uniref:hypothetical protein n=1 Tax=Marinifilum sp. N1E240 TaxID=2608082 RepID=UPI00128D360B|nr:hypothetical protein [Marinifilum sp. N1E240]MPQ47728.1 hypothetical protein [Marinifilum sp. N1E240]
MVKALMWIRVKQTYRAIVQIGLFRSVFLFGLLFFVGSLLNSYSSDRSYSQFISVGFILLLLSIHIKRGDKLFLKSHFSNFRILLLIEYLLLSLPVLSLFLIHLQWISFLELCGGIVLVSLIEFTTKHRILNSRLQAAIPADSFEWKAGVRKYFFIIIAVWIFAFIASFNIGVVPLAIFILGFITFSFYEECESYQVLLLHELNAKQFLLLKVKRQLLLFSVMVTPLILMFLIFHFDKWYIPIAEYVIFIFLHIYVIVTKYAFYEPNTKSPAAQMFGAFGALGCFIPVFIPLVWVLTIRHYLKSIDKLNFYLNDYN